MVTLGTLQQQPPFNMVVSTRVLWLLAIILIAIKACLLET